MSSVSIIVAFDHDGLECPHVIKAVRSVVCYTHTYFFLQSLVVKHRHSLCIQVL